MKRIAVVLIVGIIAASAASAQVWGPRGNMAPGTAPAVQAQNLETVKVEGKLTLVNGMIAVKEGSKTFYVGGLQRLIGFIDGLKENASVKLEGYAVSLPAAPEYQHLRVTKLTFAGKDYDLSQGFGPMMGGRGSMGGSQGGYQGGPMGGRGRR